MQAEPVRHVICLHPLRRWNMGKLDQKKKLKRKALLDSAFRLFTRQGINNTSVSDIAKEAKMAKGTFYLYYKDKYEIRDELIALNGASIFEEAGEKLDGMVKENEKCGLEDAIRFLLDYIIEKFRKNPQLLKFISKNLSWGVFAKVRFKNADNKNTMDIFKDIIKNSGRHFRSEELMIYMIVELVGSTCYSTILHSDPVSIDELKPDLYKSIDDMLLQFEV